MSRNVLEQLRRWSDAGEPVALATVADVQRSAPLPVGTKLAINAVGQLVGAVSGGCVEAAIVEQAERVLGGAAPRLMRYGLSDDEAWDIGLPCGGEIAVWVEAVEPGGAVREFLELARADARAVLVRSVEPGTRGQALLLRADGSHAGSLGAPELDGLALELAHESLRSEISGTVRGILGAPMELFIEVTVPRPRLIIIGAVDFAAHLASAARLAGWRAIVIDPRPRFATPQRFPDAEAVIVAWPQEALARLEPLDPATAMAVLTHDPKVDDAALGIALRSQAGYIGAIGSRPAQRRRRARLREAGFGDIEIDRIAGPIGLDLGALSAGETALSIMAEIVALSHNRRGGRLIEADGRIHDVAERLGSLGDDRGDQPRALLF